MAQSTYVFRAIGIGPHLLVELPLHYRLNRIRDRRVDIPALNLAGYQLLFGIGLNL